MEKEKGMSLPPGSGEWLTLLKKLPKQNNMESCQYKLKVYEDLMSVPDDYLMWEEMDDYLDRVDYRDEFVESMMDIKTDIMATDSCGYRILMDSIQRDEHCRVIWFGFLKRRIMDLKLAIEYFKLEKIEDNPGLKIDLVENYNAPVDKSYLENSEFKSKEYNRKNINDN